MLRPRAFRRDASIRLDLNDPEDQTHLADLIREAVLYLTEIHGYQLPPEIQHGENIIPLLAWSSRMSPADPTLRHCACLVLKVTHLLHYLSARELLFRLPISEHELNRRLSTKVFAVIERLRAAGTPRLVEFSRGQKRRTNGYMEARVLVASPGYALFALLSLVHFGIKAKHLERAPHTHSIFNVIIILFHLTSR